MYYVKQDNYVYQITDHLGNVRATISDTKISGSAVVLSYADYYPFGMTMAGRNMTTAPEYRLAYQGQEIDKEVGGAGFYAFELRHYDARLGKWLSADPYEQHWSPYLAMSNNPISFIDPDGGFSVFTYQQEYLQAQAEYLWNNMPAYTESTNDPWFMNSLRTVYQDGYRLGTVDAESFNALMMTTSDVWVEHNIISPCPRFDGNDIYTYFTLETFYRPSQVYGMVEDRVSHSEVTQTDVSFTLEIGGKTVDIDFHFMLELDENNNVIVTKPWASNPTTNSNGSHKIIIDTPVLKYENEGRQVYGFEVTTNVEGLAKERTFTLGASATGKIAGVDITGGGEYSWGRSFPAFSGEATQMIWFDIETINTGEVQGVWIHAQSGTLKSSGFKNDKDRGVEKTISTTEVQTHIAISYVDDAIRMLELGRTLGNVKYGSRLYTMYYHSVYSTKPVEPRVIRAGDPSQITWNKIMPMKYQSWDMQLPGIPASGNPDKN